MFLEEINQNGKQCLWIRKRFIFIRGIGFLLYNDIRMCIEKILVVESNVADNAKPICKDSKFISIAEMPIDVHLLDCLIGSSMSWHRAIGSFVRIIRIVKVVWFLKSFQLSDNAVRIFGVIFSNPSFNTRGIKDCHGSKRRIQFLADRFGQVNKTIKHRL